MGRLRQSSPLDQLLDFLNHVNALKKLPRTGWLLVGVTGPESIAEHTCAVALLALFLAETINSDPSIQGLDVPLDVGRVVQLALLHDLAESVLTDLPKRTTDLMGKEAKHAAEEQVIQQVLSGLPQGDRYRQLWQEYDAASSPEARLVKDADKLEMVHQALCYAQQGQSNLDEFWRGHGWHYPASRSLFQELCRIGGCAD